MVRHLVVPVSSPSANSVGLWSAEAAVEVPVLNAHRLHEGMGDHGADEAKPDGLQMCGQIAGFGAVHATVVPCPKPMVLPRLMFPRDVGHRYGGQQPGVVDRCLDKSHGMYSIITNRERGEGIVIGCCPWCGVKLPTGI